jgi:hypothetical protein
MAIKKCTITVSLQHAKPRKQLILERACTQGIKAQDKIVYSKTYSGINKATTEIKLETN